MSSRWKQIASLLLGLLIVGALFWYTGYGEVARALRRVSIPLVAASLVVYILSWPVRAFRMQVLLLAFDHHLGLRSLFEINIAGYGINMVLPAKLGDIARVLYLTAEQVSTSVAAATVAFIRLADLASVSVLALLAMSRLDVTLFPDWLRRLVFGVGVLLALVISLPVVTRYGKNSTFVRSTSTTLIEQIETRLFHDAIDAGKQTSADFNRLAFSPRIFLTTAFVSLVIWTLEALTAYVVAIAVGVNVPFLLIVFAVSIANIAKILPLTPAGLGIYEGAFVAVLVIHGIGAPAALSVALIEHNLKNVFNLAVGVPIATKRGTATLMDRWSN